MKESGQELCNIIQPQVNISGDTTEQLGRGEAASGDREPREPAGAGAVPQGTRGSILISISAHPPPPSLPPGLPPLLLSVGIS